MTRHQLLVLSLTKLGRVELEESIKSWPDVSQASGGVDRPGVLGVVDGGVGEADPPRCVVVLAFWPRDQKAKRHISRILVGL